MSSGDPLGNHGQRPIALAVVFEPVVAREDGMSVSAPLAHQGRAGLQHNVGIEGTSAFLELCRQSPKAALQGAARAPMGALLQLIGEPPDDQIATEPQGRSGVIKCHPGTPQLSPSSPARSGPRSRSFRPPLGPRPEAGSPECGRADATWTGGLIGPP